MFNQKGNALSKREKEIVVAVEEKDDSVVGYIFIKHSLCCYLIAIYNNFDSNKSRMFNYI